jgi:hypothetical protein
MTPSIELNKLYLRLDYQYWQFLMKGRTPGVYSQNDTFTIQDLNVCVELLMERNAERSSINNDNYVIKVNVSPSNKTVNDKIHEQFKRFFPTVIINNVRYEA